MFFKTSKVKDANGKCAGVVEIEWSGEKYGKKWFDHETYIIDQEDLAQADKKTLTDLKNILKTVSFSKDGKNGKESEIEKMITEGFKYIEKRPKMKYSIFIMICLCLLLIIIYLLLLLLYKRKKD